MRVSGWAEPHKAKIGQPPGLLPRTRITTPVGLARLRLTPLSDLRLITLTFA